MRFKQLWKSHRTDAPRKNEKPNSWEGIRKPSKSTRSVAGKRFKIFEKSKKDEHGLGLKFLKNPKRTQGLAKKNIMLPKTCGSHSPIPSCSGSLLAGHSGLYRIPALYGRGSGPLGLGPSRGHASKKTLKPRILLRNRYKQVNSQKLLVFLDLLLNKQEEALKLLDPQLTGGFGGPQRVQRLGRPPRRRGWDSGDDGKNGEKLRIF